MVVYHSLVPFGQFTYCTIICFFYHEEACEKRSDAEKKGFSVSVSFLGCVWGEEERRGQNRQNVSVVKHPPFGKGSTIGWMAGR